MPVTRREIRVNGLKQIGSGLLLQGVQVGHQERNPCQRSETLSPGDIVVLNARVVTRREIRVNGLKLVRHMFNLLF